MYVYQIYVKPCSAKCTDTSQCQVTYIKSTNQPIKSYLISSGYLYEHGSKIVFILYQQMKPEHFL